MDFYGVDHQGYCKIVTVATKPVWMAADRRKTIYVVDEDCMYYGGSSSWKKIGSGFNSFSMTCDLSGNLYSTMTDNDGSTYTSNTVSISADKVDGYHASEILSESTGPRMLLAGLVDADAAYISGMKLEKGGTITSVIRAFPGDPLTDIGFHHQKMPVKCQFIVTYAPASASDKVIALSSVYRDSSSNLYGCRKLTGTHTLTYPFKYWTFPDAAHVVNAVPGQVRFDSYYCANYLCSDCKGNWLETYPNSFYFMIMVN